MSRTKKAFINVRSSIINQIVLIISGLILPRLLIKTYGSEINGLVSTIKQMVNYGSILVIGLGAASSVALYEPIYNNEISKINGILSATKRTYKSSGYIFAFFILIMAIVFPNLTNSDLDPRLITKIIIIAGMGSIIEHIYISTYRIYLIADQQANIQSKQQTYGFILYTCLAILAIKLKLSIIWVMIALLSSYILRLFLMKRYFNEHYTFINLNVPPNYKAISKRWDAFIYQVPDILITYTPVIIIAIMLGLTEASIYSVYNIVFSSLISLIGVMSFGLQGGFGSIIASGNLEVLNKSYKSFEFLYTVITFFAYGCSLVLIKPFISVYVQDADNVNYLLPLLGSMFVISGIARALRTPAKTLSESAGMFNDNKFPNLIEAIVNFILSVLLVSKLGITGVLISSAITATVRTAIFVFYVYDNLLTIKVRKYLIQILLNIVAVYLLSFVFTRLTSDSFYDWIIYALKVSLTFGISLVILNSIIDRDTARNLLTRMKLILKRNDN
ncbi:hypothetical protein [Proteiniclasticum sp. QWL-01]|uniref:lipopolysaccharide biosynthesis protein n=1 Tax=Proteiniclasticum sp. QWL-01 TaxID=3036945 RepID=UPI0024110D20|nr:hypothetical protein [Proteiniclasticum sp. QWL-01]WFF74410.1 hypothetical protein P6M73_08150 [Proteiniclasticum sp. QWL-01]